MTEDYTMLDAHEAQDWVANEQENIRNIRKSAIKRYAGAVLLGITTVAAAYFTQKTGVSAEDSALLITGSVMSLGIGASAIPDFGIANKLETTVNKVLESSDYKSAMRVISED